MNINAAIEYLPWLADFSEFISVHPYTFIFFGLLIGGETVLLPAIYLAVSGSLNLSYLTALMVLSTLVSDIIWYYIGLGSVPLFSKRTLKPRVQHAVDRLSKAFMRNDSYVLFTSKFVYGTRIAAQVLCGIHKMPLRRYLAINTAGVLALMAVYTFIVYSVRETVDVIGGAEYRLHLAFILILATLIALQLLFKYLFKKRNV